MCAIIISQKRDFSIVSLPYTSMRYINDWVESVPLTNMRTTNGWVESILSSIVANDGGLSFIEGYIMMILHGFYILKDAFFELVNDPYLKNNKEGNRPFFYCMKDPDPQKDIYWMIPLSSRISKYQKIIEEKENQNKPCDGLYICFLPNGKESVFLIQDIFPITEKYIDREFTLGGNHLILPYQDDIDVIEKKAKIVRNLIKRGIKLTPTSPDVKSIIKKL